MPDNTDAQTPLSSKNATESIIRPGTDKHQHCGHIIYGGDDANRISSSTAVAASMNDSSNSTSLGAALEDEQHRLEGQAQQIPLTHLVPSSSESYAVAEQGRGNSPAYMSSQSSADSNTLSASYAANDNISSRMMMGMPGNTHISTPANLQQDSNQQHMQQGQGLGLHAELPMTQLVQQQVPSTNQLLQQSAELASSMSLGAKITADTPIGPQDDGTSAFTEQDEQLEMATISPTELADAETDLRGLLAQFEGLDVRAAPGSGSADQPGLVASELQLQQLSAAETKRHLEHIGPALLRLDQEIAALRPEDKEDYLTAMIRCPPMAFSAATTIPTGLVQEPWDCYRTAYLEREGYDAARAARKLCKYWRIKRSVFGTEVFCSHAATGPTGTGDMTLAQCFTQSELANYMEHNVFHVLDERDGAGRAIVFVDPNRRDLEKFSTNCQVSLCRCHCSRHIGRYSLPSNSD